MLFRSDSCTALAQETAGTVFTLEHPQIDQVLNVLSKKIGEKVQPSRCQICECQLACSWLNTPRTFCYPCEVPRPVSLGKGGSSFFNIPYIPLKAPKKWTAEALF